MTTIRAAFYAPCPRTAGSCAHQALSERASGDGMLVPPERQFVDDGYNGATPHSSSPGSTPGSC